jgi:3-deoxy-D-manno-octulosonate 8-phosphate phosphatase (KDO 8-P phosphatase)
MDRLRRYEEQGTRLLRPATLLAQQLQGVRAVLFDWDGVFNDGYKDADGGSPFSEVGSMGVNLLRFALWLAHDELPRAAIITGQHNPHAERFAQRERLHGLYMGYTHKPEAFDHFLAHHGLHPREVAFVFDDVLDLPVAAGCGFRVLVRHGTGVLMEERVMREGEADVLTARSGGGQGLREACDLMITLTGQADAVLAHRVAHDATYQAYLNARNAVEPAVHRRPR